MTGGRWTTKRKKPVGEGELQPLSWSDLPTELLELIVSRLCLEDNFRLSCVCKKMLCVARSLRVVSQSPWLLSLPDGNGVKFFDPSQGKFYFNEIPELRNAKIHCSKDGWVLFDGSFIFNPITNARINLPSCTHFPRSYVRFALSCVPTSPDCVVFTIRTDERPPNRGVFTGICHLGDDAEWTTVRYQTTDRALFRCWVGPVFCNGLFYCLSYDQLVGVFDPQKHTWSILPVPPPDLLPRLYHDEHRTIYMAEFWGKLLLVSVVYPDKPLIFKLDLPKMKWLEMESLNGATLFVSSRSSLLMIDVPRISRNSVYFAELSDCGNSSYLYSFDECRYCPANEWHEMHRISKAVWIEPPKMSHLLVKPLSWSDLPTELLELIVSRLCLEDNFRLSCVCKKMLCVARSLRVVSQSPWLMFLPDANGVKFFDPSQEKFYFNEIPGISHAKIHCSKDGWVLFDGSFIFNPITNTKINLPSCTHFPRSYVRFALSCVPTSPDCVVFTIRTDERPPNRGVFIGICHLGDDAEWTTVRYQTTDRALFRCWVGPVFCNGLFYCLSYDQLVGVFGPQKHTWSILPVPPPDLPCLRYHDQHRTMYMAEFWGKLLLISVAYPDNPLIFKLDLPKMKWVEMESLNGATLFVSSRSSLLMIDVPRISRNSVYFAELSDCGNSSYLYSFDECRYCPAKEWHEMHRISKAVWIEPPKMSHLLVKELS